MREQLAIDGRSVILRDDGHQPAMFDMPHEQAPAAAPQLDGQTVMDALRRGAGCTCPDDCGCRAPWRTAVCGCRQHIGSPPRREEGPC